MAQTWPGLPSSSSSSEAHLKLVEPRCRFAASILLYIDLLLEEVLVVELTRLHAYVSSLGPCCRLLKSFNYYRTKGIQVHLMGMATPHEVEEDLQVVREALGLVPAPNEAQEQAALKEIKALFEPIKDQTWHTGRHNNRT